SFANKSEAQFVKGLMVVKIKQDVVRGMPLLKETPSRTVRSMKLPSAVGDPLESMMAEHLIEGIVPVFPSQAAAHTLRTVRSATAAIAASVQEQKEPELRGINLIQIKKDSDAKKLQKSMEKLPGVLYCDPVPARWLTAKTGNNSKKLWNLDAIFWYDIPKGCRNAGKIKVGVIDSGFDATHPAFENCVYDYRYDRSLTSKSDILGHGTHVAGIIAAALGENGMSGMCTCNLHLWKVFLDEPDDNGEYYVDELMYLRALNETRTTGCRIINLSLGGAVLDRAEEDVVRLLVRNGITIVAAMGNEYNYGNPTEYPAAFKDVIAVGATNDLGERADFSNTGKHINLSAPGVDIVSTLPVRKSSARDDIRYGAWSGTSMATPHVTAAVAMILAKHRSLTPNQIVNRLKKATTLKGSTRVE
ncbi:MAG TPA: S8 family serine peptidase, partial [Acidobacteriota bacterium]|nr:S8 family serine peptidase [Acidobacteriota bacterium]